MIDYKKYYHVYHTRDDGGDALVCFNVVDKTAVCLTDDKCYPLCCADEVEDWSSWEDIDFDAFQREIDNNEYEILDEAWFDANEHLTETNRVRSATDEQVLTLGFGYSADRARRMMMEGTVELFEVEDYLKHFDVYAADMDEDYAEKIRERLVAGEIGSDAMGAIAEVFGKKYFLFN